MKQRDIANPQAPFAVRLLAEPPGVLFDRETVLFERHVRPYLRRMIAECASPTGLGDYPLFQDYVQYCAFPTRQLEYAFILEHVQDAARRGARILDAAVGVTPVAALLSGLGARVLAVDIRAEDIRRMALHANRVFDAQVTYQVADLSNLHDIKETFDIVTCVSVMEHMPPGIDVLALMEMLRVLRPGGRLVMTVDVCVPEATARWGQRGLDRSNGVPYTRDNIASLLSSDYTGHAELGAQAHEALSGLTPSQVSRFWDSHRQKGSTGYTEDRGYVALGIVIQRTERWREASAVERFQHALYAVGALGETLTAAEVGLAERLVVINEQKKAIAGLETACRERLELIQRIDLEMANVRQAGTLAEKDAVIAALTAKLEQTILDAERFRLNWIHESKAATAALTAQLAQKHMDAERFRLSWIDESKTAASLLEQLQARDASMEQMRTGWNNTTEAAAQLRRQLAEVHNETEKLRTSWQEALSRIARLEAQEAELAGLRAELKETSTRMTRIAFAFSELSARRDRLKGDLDTWKERSVEATQLRSQAFAELEELRLTSADMLASLEALAADRSGWEQRYQEVARQCSDWEQRYQEVARQCSDWEQRYQEVARRCSDWEQRYHEVARRCSDMEGQIQLVRNRTWWTGTWEALNAYGRRLVYSQAPPDPPPSPPPTLPKLTFVTTCTGDLAHLTATLSSVIGQGYPALEWIVAGKAPSPAVLEAIEPYAAHLRYIECAPGTQQVEDITRGFAAATGDLLGFIEPGDIFEPGALLRVGRRFSEHPEIAVACFEINRLREGWRLPIPLLQHVDLPAILDGVAPDSFRIVFTKPAYDSIGGVDPAQTQAWQHDLVLRLARRYPFHRGAGQLCSVRDETPVDQELMAHEMARLRSAVLGAMGPRERLRKRLDNLRARFYSWAKCCFVNQEISYPVSDGSWPLTQMAPPPVEAAAPVSPISGEHPERLLLSFRDARHDRSVLHRIYYHGKDGVAFVCPPRTRNGSGAASSIDQPDQPLPYQRFSGGGFVARRISRLRLPKIFRRLVGKRWTAGTAHELLWTLERSSPCRDLSLCFLSLASGETGLLTELGDLTAWKLHALRQNDFDPKAEELPGINHFPGSAESAIFSIPDGLLFDVVYLDLTDVVHDNPLALIRRLQNLLAPGGRLVLGGPNLDSRQRLLFGPTWYHWRRGQPMTLFHRRAIHRLAELGQMVVVGLHTISRPNWTLKTLVQNGRGVGYALSDGLDAEQGTELGRALGVWVFARAFWDWRGYGDWMFAVLCKQEIS